MKFTSSASRGASRRITPLASALALTLLSGLTASASASFNPIVDIARSLPAVASSNVLMPSPAGDAAYYTIVFKEAPLATYAGEIAGLPTPNRLQRGGEVTGKLDVNSAPALAYIAHLEQKQQAFVSELGNSLGRPVDVMARMQHALNAVIVLLSTSEASAVKKREDVLFIEREHELELATDRGPTFIGAPSIWTGLTASGVSTKGEGILIGDIDTGINWESPAFAAVGPIDGYVHQNPRGTGNYLGLCQAGFADVGRCNDKLIGIYNFASTAANRSGVDTQGHGSHTASTVAGNSWNATFASGQFTISGVAPHANVIAYLACPSTCASTATSQSANQAVADGVDVINYSISGGTTPWTDATSTAFRNAVAAGTFVAASAGNTSTDVPNPQGQVNHLEPWVETVAASTHDRIIAVSLKLTSETNPPVNTQDVPMRPGGLPLPTTNVVRTPIIKSPNFANGLTDGCSAYPANTFTRAYVAPEVPADRIFADGFDPVVTPPERVGAIAVLNLDSTASACGSGARRTAAVTAGAVGVIFVDVAYLNLGAADTSWSMLRSDWNNLEAASNPATATVSIDIAARGYPGIGDVVAGFSFRGPRLVNGQGIVKPDITAPGVDILAVGASNLVGANGVYLNNGTSMSSPHMAGAAALMRALNPTWSPTQIKSALNLTSNNFGAVNQDGTPVRIWDYGSGRVNLSTASKVGLIMDETPANFLAANPSAGGDVSTLNLASLAKYNIIGSTTFTRTFRRARSGSQTYTLSLTGLPTGAATFSPASFSINSAGSRTVTVTVNSGLLAEGVWNFGELTLTPSGGDEPSLHLPITVFPGGPAIAVTPASLSGTSDTTVSNNLTISNTANPTLNWLLQTTGTATVTPLNTTSTTNGWQGGTYSGFTPVRGYHWSQNFDVSSTMRVTTLRANGFTLPNTTSLTTANTPSVTFSVYADNAGNPAGAPQGFGAAPVWTFAGAISTANGITTTGGAIALNLNATNVAGTPLNLSPGRYWLTVSPSINGTGAQTATNPLWAWYVGADAQVGSVPKLYAPWDDPTQFQTAEGLTQLSAFVQGTVNCSLPAWVNVATTSGSLGFAGSQTVPVTFSASGLAAGTYSGALCISSNATNQPVVTVPLTFTVPNGGAQIPTVTKAFAPASVATGASSALTITLANTNAAAATLNAALVDTFPSGLVVAATPAASTTCGGTVTATTGSSSVSLASASSAIPANGSCTVTVNVTSAAAGSYLNTIAAGALQTSAGNNATPASATLTVTAPFPAPYCARSFSTVEPITRVVLANVNNVTSATLNGTPALEDFTTIVAAVAPGGTYTITTEGNSDGNFLNVYRAYIDWNHDGVFNEDASERYEIGSITNSTGVDGKQTSVGITVPAGALTGTTRMRVVKNYNAVGLACGSATSTYGQAEDYTINVDPSLAAPPTLGKTFAPTNSNAGTSSVLTITLGNVNATALTTTAALTDTLPTGLLVAGTPNAATTCGGTLTAVAGGSSVTLNNGATIPSGGCTITVNVSAANSGIYVNTIAAGALQTSGGASGAAATATYQAIQAGIATYSTGFETPFTIANITGQQGWFASVAADWKVVATNPANGTQNLRGTWTAAGSGTSFALSPTQLAGTTAYSSASAKLAITVLSTGAIWDFAPQDTIAGSVITRVRFLNGAGNKIQVLDPNGGTPIYVDTGATWTAGAYFDLKVVAKRSDSTYAVCLNGASIWTGQGFAGNVMNVATIGTKGTGTQNNILDVDDLVIDNTNTGGCGSGPAPVAPTVSKAFAPTSVTTGTPSTLTITLANSNATPATLSAALTDSFPSGLVVATAPAASTTCGGALAAAAGASSVSLASAGSAIPANGSCTVTVNVQSASVGSYANTIAAGALQTSAGNNIAAANATLTVAAITRTVTPSVSGGNGSIAPATPQTVNDGATTNFTLTPNSGYHIDNVSGTCGGSLAGNVYTTAAITANCTVIASFAVTVVQCSTGSPVEVQATAGSPGPTGYTTLKSAFDAINAGTHQGTLNVDICGDTTETASAALNASGTGAALYTSAAVKPAGGALRTVSGAITAGSPLIDLVGANNVTIDGLNTGGNALTISNATASATAGTSTIRFINGASNNTVTKATVLGSSTAAVAVAAGNILFSTSTVAGGNSNNRISSNDIGPAGSNLPTKGVTGLGTAANLNSDNVIDGNMIHDFFSPTVGVSGISVQGNNNNWTISNNRIYQTAARAFTGTVLRYAGITLTASSGSFTVTGNTIGFGAANGTGTTTISGSTNTFRGVDAASTSLTVTTTIQGNVISGINQTTASTATSTTTNFVGIMAGSTDGLIAVTGNTIGSLDGSSTIVVNSTAGSGTINGIYNFSNLAANVSNNIIGSITIQGSSTTNGFRGILVNTSATQLATIAGNTIANITNTQVGSYAMYAIQTSLPPLSVTDNTIRDFTGNANAASVVMSGIISTAGTSTLPSTIARNSVHSLRNVVTGGAAGAIYAIDLTLGTQANIVERNLVHSITVDSTLTAYQIFGLIMRGTSPSTATVKNNMIRLGLDAAGASITTPFSFVGIRDSAGTNVANSYYHNSVYIGGTGVAASGSNSYALNSDTVTTTRNFQNNIFWNARSNAVGGGIVHLAVRMGGTTPNPAGLTSSHNDILASGTDGVTGLYNGALTETLADWQAATGQDANSFATDPQFIAPNGSAVSGNLHISPTNPTPIEAKGLAIASVTNDFDGDDRSTLTPTDIGADAGNFVPLP